MKTWKRERAVAMRCVAAALSKHNQNVANDDLVACINDLAQAKITAIDNYNELLVQVRKVCPELADRLA